MYRSFGRLIAKENKKKAKKTDTPELFHSKKKSDKKTYNLESPTIQRGEYLNVKNTQHRFWITKTPLQNAVAFQERKRITGLGHLIHGLSIHTVQNVVDGERGIFSLSEKNKELEKVGK